MLVAAGVVLHAQLPARHELVARLFQYASPRRLALLLGLRSARFGVPQPAEQARDEIQRGGAGAAAAEPRLDRARPAPNADVRTYIKKVANQQRFEQNQVIALEGV